MTAQAWEWQGEQLTVREIMARITPANGKPAYSDTIVRQALKEGATCVADLHQRHAEGLARQKAGSNNNSRTYWRGTRACSTR